MRYRGHRSKLADNNISVRPRGNRVRDAISQSARAVGFFLFFFSINARPQTARDGGEENDRKCPSNSSVRTPELPVSPSALPACFVAEGHIYILLAGQLPSDATRVQIVRGDGADTGGK